MCSDGESLAPLRTERSERGVARIFLTPILGLGLGLALAVSVASASRASTVTRIAADLYKIDGTSLWLRTRYCYEYVYGEEMTLANREMKFTHGRPTCAVREFLKEAYIVSGDRTVIASLVGDNLYYINDRIYLRTRWCRESGTERKAVLSSAYAGPRTLAFEDNGKRCAVENILMRVDVP